MSDTVPSTISPSVVTSPTPTAQPPPLTKIGRYTRADACVQSCALSCSSEISSLGSCPSDNPGPCICSVTTPGIGWCAHNCGNVVCGTLSKSGYRPQVTGKMIVYDYCSGQGVILEVLTTSSTTPNLAVVKVEPPATTLIDNTPSTSTAVPSSSRVTSVDNDFASEPPILHSHQTSISPPSPSTSSTTSRTNSPSPQIIVGSTLGALFGILIFSLISFFLWHRKRARKNKTAKQNELTSYMDAEDQHGDFLGKENRRLSKPFDKLVEVCEFKSNQPPDWTRAQKTTLAVDTQCQNANYISPHLVKSLDLSPEYLETPFELTGVGEETMSVDQKVQLIFRKARTYQNDDKRYQPVTFFVLKKDQEEFGLLLGTPDCLRMNVVGRAVLVLRPKQKKPVKDENREKDVDRHREESRKDKDAQKKKSKAKKKHGDNADRGDGDRTRNENRG